MRRREAPAPQAPAMEHEQSLFERLRSLRLRLAAKNGVPPYVIFSDRSLREMAALAPRSRNAFLRIHGVGETQWELYGDGISGGDQGTPGGISGHRAFPCFRRGV